MTAIYKNILIPVDFFNPQDQLIVQKGIQVAQLHSAKITLLHAIEYPFVIESETAYPLIIKSQHEIMNEARNKLKKLVENYSIQDSQLVVEIGVPKVVILDFVKKHGIDLIIMGSHGRHGINLLLMGSTTHAVLNHVKCDVLTIRIR